MKQKQTENNPQKAAKSTSNAHAEPGPGLQVTRGYGTAREILRFDLNFTLWYNGAQSSAGPSLCWLRKEKGSGGMERSRGYRMHPGSLGNLAE